MDTGGRHDGGERGVVLTDEAVLRMFSIVIPVSWSIPVELKIRLLSRIVRLV